MTEGKGKFYKAIGWGLFGGGIVLLVITAATNWFQGDHLGVTVAGKWINSLGSVTIDLVGLVFIGMAAGSCWAIRRYTWATLFTLALVLSAGWSANSILSFQATERISASKTRDTTNKRSATADKIAEDHVKWTRGTSVTGDLARNERKIYLEAASNEIKKFRETKVQTYIEPDAGAQVIANATGYNLETVQIGQSGYFALLLIFLKALCFPGAGYFLNPLAFAVAQPPKDEPNSSDSGGSTGSSGGSSGSGKSPSIKLVGSSAKQGGSTAVKARSAAPSVHEAGAPNRKLSRDQVMHRLRRQVAGIEPKLSSHKNARAMGWPQRTIARYEKRLREQTRSQVRRFAGNGGGFHAVIG